MSNVYTIDEAQGIATQTQAYEAQGAAAQAVATTVRSQSGTAAALTIGTRASKATTTGSLANDLFFESDTGFLYYWTGTAWAFMLGIGKGTAATFATITVTAADNGAEYYVTDTGSWWYVAGGAWVERPHLNVTTEYRVAGNKVVGARGAAVPDATGGAVIDTEARAAINALLARFRVTGGSGAIAD